MELAQRGEAASCEAELRTLNSVCFVHTGLVDMLNSAYLLASTVKIPNESDSVQGARSRSCVVCLGWVLFFVLSLACHFEPVAGQVEFKDDTVMHQSVNDGGGRDWVLEDLFPL